MRMSGLESDEDPSPSTVTGFLYLLISDLRSKGVSIDDVMVAVPVEIDLKVDAVGVLYLARVNLIAEVDLIFGI